MKVFVKDEHLVKLVKAVYDNSRPQGLGFILFDPKPLEDNHACKLISTDKTAISLDYLRGRACKFEALRIQRDVMRDGVMVSESGVTCFANMRWYDHIAAEIDEVLKSVPHEIID